MYLDGILMQSSYFDTLKNLRYWLSNENDLLSFKFGYTIKENTNNNFKSRWKPFFCLFTSILSISVNITSDIERHSNRVLFI